MDYDLKKDSSLFRLIMSGDYLDLVRYGYLARNDIERIDISASIPWKHVDRNVEFNLQAWRFLNPAANIYFNNHDAVPVLDIFNMYERVILEWDENALNSGSKFLWYDMAVGIRAMHLSCYLYIKEKHDFTQSESVERKIQSIVSTHIQWLSKKSNITKGNHAVYQIVGLKLLSYIRRTDEFIKFCDFELNNLFNEAFDEHFVNTENSPFYHKYNIDLYSKIPSLLFPRLQEKILGVKKQGLLVTKWLTDPNGYFYQIGDTEGKGLLLDKIDIVDKNRSGIDNLVYKDMGGSGYQVVRSEPTIAKEDSFYFIFRGISPSDIHSHCDALSFVFGFAGHEIFSDPGKFTYEYNEDRDWAVSDASHSTAGCIERSYFPRHINRNHNVLFPVRDFTSGLHMLGNIVKRNEFTHTRNIKISSKRRIDIVDFVSSPEGLGGQVRFLFSPHVENVRLEDCALYLTTDFKIKLKLNFYGNFSNLDLIDPESGQAWISREYQSRKSTFMVKVNSVDSIFNLSTSIQIMD